MMMCNLFFIFDPSLSVLGISWMSLMTFMFLPLPIFLYSNMNMLINYMSNLLSKEISFNVKQSFKGLNSFMATTFALILIYNFTALLPHVFSLTSHLAITLPTSYIMWSSIVLFNLVSFFKHFMTHLIPIGTPTFLMSFMVIVELLSNLIRPLALTFRLTANMMAGHLLMSLVSSALLPTSFMPTLVIFSTQFLLTSMEMGVSIIQAYVFFTLLVLYKAESNK